MIIKVTQKHIDDGLRTCAGLCPVALALKEATGLNATVYSQIFLWEGDKSKGNKYQYDAPTPPHVLDRIDNFDKYDLMTSFEFEIDYENPSD